MKCFRLAIFLPFCFFFALPCLAEEPPNLQQDLEKVNYSLGYQVGSDFKKQGITLDKKVFIRGVQEALAGEVPSVPKGRMANLLVSLKQKIIAEQKSKQTQNKEAYRGEDRAFLAENAQKDGVIRLPSGVQYMILRNGNGEKPAATDTVNVHYRSTTVEGKEFYNTYKKNAPATFSVSEVIQGLGETLQLMQAGSKWKVFIPADLAFGESGPLAERAVIYEIELLSIAEKNTK